MTLRPTRVDLGLNLNGDAFLLAGVGIPGTTTITNEALIGSRYSNTVDGALFTKFAAGSGTDKWQKIASESFVTSQLASLISWREPAEVNDSTSTVLPTGTPGDPITVDGESIGDGERVLFSAIVGGDGKNIYIYDQTTGTFVEDLNAETSGDTTYVIRGTDAGVRYTYNGTDWIRTDASSQDELGFIRAFIGKNNSGSETPNYGTPVVVTNGVNLETAIGELDTAIGDRLYTEDNVVTDGQTLTASIDALDVALGDNTFTESNIVSSANDITENLDALDIAVNNVTSQNTIVNVAGVTTTTTIDTIPLAEAQYIQWMVVAENTGDSTNVFGAMLIALTDGDSVVDFSRNDVLRNGPNITGLTISAVAVGANVELQVTSTTAVDVGAKRMGFVAAN